MAKKQPTIMISSTVYGIEELLERAYALLTQFGYNVWCSHMGTLPVVSSLSAFENCLKGVEDCDLFLGIITPRYGTGQVKGELSITHQELLKAIELEKPRWFLAHSDVIFARSLFRQIGHATPEERAKLAFKPSNIIDDLRCIDMYEAAIRDEIKLQDRKGNWVQKYVGETDFFRYATAQFYRFQEVERFVEEHLADRANVMRRVEEDKSRSTDDKGVPS